MVEHRNSAICAEGVSVILGKAQILQDVSIAVRCGELGVIAGPNGAGKSTLLRVLLGLVPCSSGQVFCQGRQMAALSPLQRASAIAYVPQRSQLDAALEVKDVIALGRFGKRSSEQDREQAIAAAMAQVGIAALAERNYLNLSGGEKRLTLIARALCTGAKIICLDEPTACLDIANRLRVMALLRTLADDGYAILCVLHELEDVHSCADRVTLLHRGSVVRSGSAEEVIAEALVRSVYAVEMRPNTALGFVLASSAAEEGGP